MQLDTAHSHSLAVGTRLVQPAKPQRELRDLPARVIFKNFETAGAGGLG